MAIVRPENMDFSEQKFSAIIYGSPGTGKTTLALSAPNPVLIDFDQGISRVKAAHRKPTIICSTYEDVLNDIHSPEIAEFQTVVIDTGGSFVTYLKDWAMRVKGAKQKNGEFNSLKGFGFVKSEFQSFTDYVKTVLHKNIIYVFHSQEQTDKDGNPTQRLMCEGSVRNTVWNPCDFGGYLQMIGNKRFLCFTPTQEYFAKGTHGIIGQIEIPELRGMPNENHFMTGLFDMARANIRSELEIYAPLREQYDSAIAAGAAIINSMDSAEDVNSSMEAFKGIPHALTSEKELVTMWNGKIKDLGLVFDKDSGKYIVKESEDGK